MTFRRVLIVSPRFPPTNAADMHRVRQCLPHLADFGWEAVVLAVDPRWCDQPVDDLLSATVPSTTRVRRVGALDPRLTRRLGVGNLEFRSYWQVRRAGAELLASEPFDLVFFSTTAFGLLSLGPVWKRRFGVPFVVDLQDPWVSDYHDRPGAPPPPGGRFKYRIMQGLARIQERSTMREVDHVVSVSPAYPRTLLQRHPSLRPEQFTVLPFGAAETDFEVLGRADIRQDVFDPRDGKEHWVYVGRGGDDMALALEAFFLALARARAEKPGRYGGVRLHFVGTSYATDNRAVETVRPVAARCGVADLVEERPRRIPYFEGLRCLLDADALVVPGSDDPGYTASKLYPYILSRRPLLTVFHERSTVAGIVRECRAGTVVTFRSGEPAAALSDAITEAWFAPEERPPPDTDWAAFARYSAGDMTRRLCHVFDGVVDHVGTRTT